MFQRAEGCAALLPNAIGRGKERVPAVSLSLWPCPLHPLPQNNTAPTLKLATSNRKAQVLHLYTSEEASNDNRLSILVKITGLYLLRVCFSAQKIYK